MIGKDFATISENNLFPCVPLVNYSKIPVVPWSNQEFWIKDIKDLEALGATYKREIEGKTKGGQLTGLSLLCGKVSGIMVIDLDVGHDDNVNGIDSFNEFIKEFPDDIKEQILNTFSVKTPRGGTHLYFKYKEGLKSKAAYISGVDVRSDGGLIIVPGSKTRVDKEVREYKPIGQAIQDMPQILFDKFMELDKKVATNTTKSTVNGEVLNSDSMDKAVEAFNSSKHYKQISEGGRDDALFTYLLLIASNPSMRTTEALFPQAMTYNKAYLIPPLTVDEVKKKVESALGYKKKPYFDEKGNIDNWNLVQHILKERPSYTKGNLWYLYNAEKGFYDYLEPKQVQQMYFKYSEKSKDKTPVKSKSFAELLMINSEDAKNVHDEKKYINCLNGVIDIEKDALLPHDHNYKLEVQFQADYKPDNWIEKFNNSEFKKFLETTLDEGSILTLQEAWGLELSPHAKEVQNAFIYKGEGANGKTAAFDIQEALLDDNRHICSIGLGDFGEPFTISVAEGKHVNIVRDDELSGKTVNKFFKSMVCGEPVTVNKKNKDLVRLGFNMTMFFGLNRMPGASDKSTGFFRRPIIIPFNVSFGTEKEVESGLRDKVKDVGIAERIVKNELDIVFMWAYEGLQRLRSNKWRITVSEAAEREKEEYREEVDSVYAFFNEKIILKKGSRAAVDVVYKSYLYWCSNNDITPMNKIQAGRQFKSFGLKNKPLNKGRYWLDVDLNDIKQVDDNIYPFC